MSLVFGICMCVGTHLIEPSLCWMRCLSLRFLKKKIEFFENFELRAVRENASERLCVSDEFGV